MVFRLFDTKHMSNILPTNILIELNEESYMISYVLDLFSKKILFSLKKKTTLQKKLY